MVEGHQRTSDEQILEKDCHEAVQKLATKHLTDLILRDHQQRLQRLMWKEEFGSKIDSILH